MLRLQLSQKIDQDIANNDQSIENKKLMFIKKAQRIIHNIKPMQKPAY